MLGWVRHASDEWETTMHNMKVKVARAMEQFYVRPWDQRICEARKKNFARIASMDCKRWESLAMGWEPTQAMDESQDFVAHRRPGRPLLRWTDKIVNE